MISICLTTFNGEKFFLDQINSILLQISKFDEIIISDDSENDHIKDYVDFINDSRIKYLKGPKKGINKNFENAIKKSKGDFIFLSDQDDIWHQNKVKMNMSLLKEYELILSNCTVVDENLNISKKKLNLHAPKINFLSQILIKNSFMGCCMSFRRDLIDDFLPFPENISMYDWWIGLISILSKRKIFYVEEPLIFYRKHSNNASSTGLKSKNSFLTKFLIRIRMAFEILKFKIRKKFYE